MDFPSSGDDLVSDIATYTSSISLDLARKNFPVKSTVGLDLTHGMLSQCRQILEEADIRPLVPHVCASAMRMPFALNILDFALCCLMSHHMDVSALVANLYQALKPGGSIFLADKSGSSAWKNAVIKRLVKTAAFFYFFFQENLSLAKAEAGAIGYILSAEEWKESVSIEQSLKKMHPDFEGMEDIVGKDNLKMTRLPDGEFNHYKEAAKASGAGLAHLTLPHMQLKDHILSRLTN